MNKLILLIASTMLIVGCSKEEIEISQEKAECNKYKVVRVWDIFNEPDKQRAWLWNREREHLIDSLVDTGHFLRGESICLD